jgi:hypothetical protein
LNDPLAPVRVMTMFPNTLVMFVAAPSPILIGHTYWPMILTVYLERERELLLPKLVLQFRKERDNVGSNAFLQCSTSSLRFCELAEATTTWWSLSTTAAATLERNFFANSRASMEFLLKVRRRYSGPCRKMV